MTVTVFIRYQIDPFQREAFRAYAQAWLHIIPRCGGDLLGCYLPSEHFILREERTFLENVEGS